MMMMIIFLKMSFSSRHIRKAKRIKMKVKLSSPPPHLKKKKKTRDSSSSRMMKILVLKVRLEEYLGWN